MELVSYFWDHGYITEHYKIKYMNQCKHYQIPGVVGREGFSRNFLFSSALIKS